MTSGSIEDPSAKVNRNRSALSTRLTGTMGVAKPGRPVASDMTCRAAHEKIAFDLAHRLDLPIPPVVLWGKDLGQPYARGRSISAWAKVRGSNPSAEPVKSNS
jgi:hypothetical protein